MSEGKRPGDSVRITREYFDSLLLEMRHMDSMLPSTALTLYGETFSTPVMTAALSHLNNAHPDGLVEMARGAAQANAVMWCGMGDEDELARIIDTGARTIKIIKPYADEDMVLRRIAHAEQNGAFAIGMDLDHAFGRKGGYDNVLGHEMRPRTTARIRDYVSMTKLPFIIKGVLSERDAEKCLEAGVRGIVVSHHHGIMDSALPPLRVLKRIAKLVAGRMPIFVDCGFESGMDVFKALALGATAVSAGRVLMGSLGKEGADGVQKAIDEMTAGLSYAMAMTASKDLASIDPDVLWDESKR